MPKDLPLITDPRNLSERRLGVDKYGNIVTNNPQNVFDRANALHRQGKIKEAYEVLAREGGDEYAAQAALAVDKSGVSNFNRSMVNAAWDAADVGVQERKAKEAEFEKLHQANILGMIENSNFRLPNTRGIDASYQDAAKKTEVPPAVAAANVLNDVNRTRTMEQSIIDTIVSDSMFLNPAGRLAAQEIGALVTPEWSTPLGIGEDRVVENSPSTAGMPGYDALMRAGAIGV